MATPLRADRFRLEQLLSAIDHDRVTPELIALVDVPGESAAAIAVHGLGPQLAGRRGDSAPVRKATAEMVEAARSYIATTAGTLAAAASAAALVSRDERVIDRMLCLETPASPQQIKRLGQAIVGLPIHSRERTIAAVECEHPEFGRILRHAADPARSSRPTLDIIRGMLSAPVGSAEMDKWAGRAALLITDGIPERVARVVAESLYGADGIAEGRARLIGREYVAAYPLPKSRTKRVLCVLGLCTEDRVLQATASAAVWRAPEDLHDIAGEAGVRVVELAAAGDRSALELVCADYPEWGEVLSLRLVEVRAAQRNLATEAAQTADA